MSGNESADHSCLLTPSSAYSQSTLKKSNFSSAAPTSSHESSSRIVSLRFLPHRLMFLVTLVLRTTAYTSACIQKQFSPRADVVYMLDPTFTRAGTSSTSKINFAKSKSSRLRVVVRLKDPCPWKSWTFARYTSGL